MHWDLIVIGGGAAGFFGAIRAAELNPNLKILILEQHKCLQKVRISGGGRCNVTHNQPDNNKLIEAYPRGNPELREAFKRFNITDTIAWFEKRGLKLKAEPDGRMFPVTDCSESVIKVFQNEVRRLGIKVLEGYKVASITSTEIGFEITTPKAVFHSFKTLVTIGGGPNSKHWDLLTTLGLASAPPIPSLFTFNLPDDPVRELMGLSVPQAKVTLPKLKSSFEGPLLITHWGISGPAVLKLSAFAALPLSVHGYHTSVEVNWLTTVSAQELQQWLAVCRNTKSAKTLANLNEFDFPKRLWEYFLQKSGIDPSLKLASLGKKSAQNLLDTLHRDTYTLRGKTTYKEEFVTAGGILTEEIDLKTFESKKIHGLYLAGEALNVDGITGGFNFQAAWATGYCAGTHIAQSL